MFNKIKSIFKKKISDVKGVITEQILTQEKFEELMWDLEIELLQANLAPQVIDLLKKELETRLVGERLRRGDFRNALKQSIKDTFQRTIMVEDFYKRVESFKKPVKIMFVGFNGVGKTTTLAKIAYQFQKQNKKMVFAACDTFRAASIEQLGQHAEKLGIKIIKHSYGSDSAAVAFDAVEHAKATGSDFVLIDTAGRSHENINLMQELEKLNRVIKPDVKILVIDSLTGSDSVNQAKKFDDAINIDYLILTKTDSDTKGGTVLSVSYVLGKPIIFLGTGQDYDDLVMPNPKELIQNVIKV